jgi:hypothetical protein
MEAQPSGQAVPDVPSHHNEVDLNAMTEEEQLEWALKMSMTNGGEETKATEGILFYFLFKKLILGAGPSTQDNAMEIDNDIGQLMDDPELLQQLVQELPDETNESKKKEEKPENKG